MNKVAGLSLLGLICLVCQCCARPQENAAASSSANEKKENITIVKSEVTPLNDKGSFGYDIELSDGTKFIQSGHTEAPAMGETEPSFVIEGSYAYVAPNGKQISITYVADKNGFQPKGDAIPTQGSAQPNAPGAAASADAAPPPAPQASEPPAAAAAAAAS